MKRFLIVIVLLAGVAQASSLRPLADGAQAGKPALHLSQYIDGLQSIRASDPTQARVQAQQLNGATVEGPNGRFDADSALLHEVMASPQAAAPHLAATIAALRASAFGTAANSDPKLLERLRKEEQVAALQAGGEIRSPGGDQEVLEQTGSWFERFGKWFGKQMDKLAQWFDRWSPQSREPKTVSAPLTTRWMVILLVIVIVVVIAVLAFEVVRRSRAATAEPVVASDPITSKRDEDPLSRGATEWERYATQLAAAGRIREAIRAWYHAVLVTLYAAGILHFRKGRTNWEYVAALSPDISWRAQFITLTRRFEEEWYGHDRSSVDALDECSSRARDILDSVRRRAAA